MNGSTGGWITLHRKLLDNPIAGKPRHLSLWVTLLLLANHEDKGFIWKNQKSICKRGQLITSRASLSSQTGISQSTVEDILTYLEKEGNIRQQGTSKFRLITVVNYSTYQEKQQQTIQQKDSKPYTNNNVTREQVDIALVASQLGVATEKVQAEWERASDWLKSKGKTYKDYNAFLRNWIRGRDRFDKVGGKPKHDDWITNLVRG